MHKIPESQAQAVQAGSPHHPVIIQVRYQISRKTKASAHSIVGLAAPSEYFRTTHSPCRKSHKLGMNCLSFTQEQNSRELCLTGYFTATSSSTNLQSVLNYIRQDHRMYQRAGFTVRPQNLVPNLQSWKIAKRSACLSILLLGHLISGTFAREIRGQK